MDDGQLRAFIRAADSGSFSKAANDLFLTPPAFIRRITLLESELGSTLFFRDRTGSKLTKEGQLFYPNACKILAILDKARFQSEAQPSAPFSPARVFFGTAPGAQFSPERKLFDAAREAFSEIELVVVPVNSADQIPSVANGEIDLCFKTYNSTIENLGLDFIPLLQDTFSLCFFDSNLFMGRTSVSLEDLDGRTIYIDIDEDPDMFKLVARAIADHGLDIELADLPCISFTSDRIASADFILCVPTSYANSYTPFLHPVKLEGFVEVMGFVCRPNPSAALKKLLDPMRFDGLWKTAWK